MTPTPKMLFVDREIGYSKTGKITDLHTVRILQQWWEVEQNIIDRAAGKTHGEWRDVPLEQEQA